MGSSVSHKLLVSAVAIALGATVALPGQAFDAVEFNVTGANTALTQQIKAASGLVGAKKDRPALDLFADAQAEYGKIISALYASGHYGPVVHVLIDGHEAASIAPLDAPSRIGHITVTVDPGPQFTFSQAQIAPLARHSNLPPGFAAGKPALSGMIKGAVAAGLDGWRNEGNAKADVAGQDLTADHASATLSASVQLAPGPVLRFGDLVINGATTVREARVRKIAGLPSGKRFSPADEARMAERLRRSGVFSSVSLTEDDKITAPDLLGLTADLVEAKPHRYTFGAEVATNDGLGLNGSWLHRNLLGGGERFDVTGAVTNISAAGSGMDYSLGTTLDRPATPGPDTTLNLSFKISHLDDADYTANVLATGFGFTHYFSETLTGHAALSYTYSAGRDVTGDFIYRNVALPVGVTWDRRDSKTDATKDFYIDLNVKPFLGFGTADNGVRVAFDGRYYKTLGAQNGIVLATRVQGGAVIGASVLGTPRTDLFYSGGGGTVRGQPYQSLGVTVPDGLTMVDTGGTSFVAASLEARVRVTELIGIVGFVDAGSVGVGGFSGNAWQAGAGLGLRYATGVGPIRLDIGVPIHRKTNEKFQIYIGLGQAF